jgi:hypothetical protein
VYVVYVRCDLIVPKYLLVIIQKSLKLRHRTITFVVYMGMYYGRTTDVCTYALTIDNRDLKGHPTL